MLRLKLFQRVPGEVALNDHMYIRYKDEFLVEPDLNNLRSRLLRLLLTTDGSQHGIPNPWAALREEVRHALRV